MDRQSAPPPFQRPPDSQTVVNNKYHPPVSQSYSNYPPPTSQPQQPLHAPFNADPYSMPRRDPFFPAGPQHARKSSQGVLGGDNAPQSQGEGGQSGWANSGMA
ncbi:hypothetical protein IQ07DRAFT_587571 [Pyrenochaeta sp. DS3sAY3a]|nr:hypothetical protein IQ07DRAFT_587571 [Pyrenochaeta sp. DS3sAY3a]